MQEHLEALKAELEAIEKELQHVAQLEQLHANSLAEKAQAVLHHRFQCLAVLAVSAVMEELDDEEDDHTLRPTQSAKDFLKSTVGELIDLVN